MSLDDCPSTVSAGHRESFSAGVADAVPILISYVDRDERYRFVNRAYEAWFGKDRSQIEGRTVADVVGEAAYAKVRHHVAKALSGEPVVYEGQLPYRDAGLRHIEARFAPDFDGGGKVLGYYVLVTDITARKAVEQALERLLERERRRAALLELGRQLREEADPEAVAHRACKVMAELLGVDRAGYAHVLPGGLRARHVGEWMQPGMPPLTGEELEMDAFGPDMSADLRVGRPVVIDDVARDPRTRDPAVLAAYATIQVGSFVTAPLIKQRRIAAYIYAGDRAARVWTEDEIAFVADVAELIWTATDRAMAEAALRKAEDTERLLIREVDHRAKNVLAVVQSLAHLTPFESKQQYVEALSGRIGSLARSHSLLSTSRWTGVRLDALLRQELEPYGAGSDDRVTLEGPPVLIEAQAAQSLGLVVHELATNASKYGALLEMTGALTVSWAWEDDRRLALTWRETSARTLTPPSHRGFGSTLIISAAKQLGATLEKDWRPEGLTCRLEIARGAVPCEPEITDGNLMPAGQPPESQALRDQRVLVVEDEALVAMELARVLTSAGAHVVGPAGSIEEALDLVNRHTIDRAVLDVNLGGRMVTPVARALSERAIPFIYLTGYQEPGVDDGPVLRKPATSELLLGALAGGIAG